MTLRRPNILLITIDCLRAGSVYGPKCSAHIPNLQSLAKKGLLFSHVITVNSVTPPCVTSMFSGMYPVNHGVRGMRGYHVSDEFPLLAETLHDNGYNTYAEMAGPLIRRLHLNRGFIGYNYRESATDLFLGEWGDQLIARFRNGEFREPWFIYLHLWEVHQPRRILPQYNHPNYGKTDYDRALTSVDARLGDLLEVLEEDTMLLITGDHGEKIPESNLEAKIERAKAPLVGLRRSSLLKKVVLTSLIRKAWYGSARFLHRVGLVGSPLSTLTGHGYHVYDSLVRVPLIISGYSLSSAGQIISDQTGQIDIYPTILDMIGLGDKIPDIIDGRSVVPLIQGEKLPSLPAFIETWTEKTNETLIYGVRFDDWKYAYSPDNARFPDELYDLWADPDETNNLAATRLDKVAEMRKLADQHFQASRTDQEAGVLMTEEELAELTERLRDLGYIEE